MKHNKKRNTAFLFEVLTREATKATLAKDFQRLKAIKDIMVEHFNTSTEMGKEMTLYKALSSSVVEKDLAEKYLKEVKSRHDRLDGKIIFNEQTNLINKINKGLGASVYNNFVPNYKHLATIAQIFNDQTSIKEKVLLEGTVIEEISLLEEKQENSLKPVDSIVLKTFTNKFNEKYSGLLSEQKDLLNRFVGSFADDGIDLVVFVNEEIQRLKEGVVKALSTEEIKSDKDLQQKTFEVQSMLNNFKETKEITQDTLQKILKIQQFVHEVNN
jgi:hypothetical protein